MTRTQFLATLAGAAALLGGTAAIAQPPAGQPGGGMRGGRMMMMADANKDGTITRAEATAAADARFARADANRDGTVTPQERQATRDQMRGQWAQKRFAALDTDRNGQLSLAEFSARREGREGMRRGGGRRGGMAMNQPTTQAQARERALAMFDRLDANRDGQITATEREAARGMRHQRGGTAARPQA